MIYDIWYMVYFFDIFISYINHHIINSNLQKYKNIIRKFNNNKIYNYFLNRYITKLQQNRITKR